MTNDQSGMAWETIKRTLSWKGLTLSWAKPIFLQKKRNKAFAISQIACATHLRLVIPVLIVISEIMFYLWNFIEVLHDSMPKEGVKHKTKKKKNKAKANFKEMKI